MSVFQRATFLVLAMFMLLCNGNTDASSDAYKSDQQKREQVFLCGASNLYVNWTVTFDALRKRAEKVKDAADKIVNDSKLYQNAEEVKKDAEGVIEKVKTVVGNTSRALSVSREFMDGIERDFFNAFEGIKDGPQNFVYGHSNLNTNDGRRISEVLGFFNNITEFFMQCKNGKGETVTVELLEQKMMMEVDNVSTDLTTWEQEQISLWNSTYAKVDAWLTNMTKYKPGSRLTNIWSRNETVPAIINEDCDKIHANNRIGSSVPDIVDAAYKSVLRHMGDVANSTNRNSLEENGCNATYRLFIDTVSQETFVKDNVDKKKEAIKAVCDKIVGGKTQYLNCTAGKTPVSWLRKRFGDAVPEIIALLNHSLVQLKDAERVVLSGVGELIVEKRKLLCDEARALDTINSTFDKLGAQQLRLSSSISSLEASLATQSTKVTEALRKSESVLVSVKDASNLSLGSLSAFKEAEKAHASVQAAAEKVKGESENATEAIQRFGLLRSSTEKISDEMKTALEAERKHLGDIRENFTQALKLANSSDAYAGVISCTQTSFDAPNVLIDAADAVLNKLVGVTSFGGRDETKKTLQQIEGKITSLKKLETSVRESNNTVTDAVAKAMEDANYTAANSNKAKKIFEETTLKETKKKIEELCTAHRQLLSAVTDVNVLNRGRDQLSEKAYLISEKTREVESNAFKSVKACSDSVEVVQKAVRTASTVSAAADVLRAAVATNKSCDFAFKNVMEEAKLVGGAVDNAIKASEEAKQLQSVTSNLIEESRSQFTKLTELFKNLLKDTTTGIRASSGNICNWKEFSLSYVSYEDAVKIAQKLHHISVPNNDSLVKNLTALKTSLASLSSHVSEAEQHDAVAETKASEVNKSAEEAAKSSEEAQQIAIEAVRNTIEKKREELCAAGTELRSLSAKSDDLKKRGEFLHSNVTVLVAKAAEDKKRASEAALTCRKAAEVAKEAMRTSLVAITDNVKQDSEELINRCTLNFESVERAEELFRNATNGVRAEMGTSDEKQKEVHAVLATKKSELHKVMTKFSNAFKNTSVIPTPTNDSICRLTVANFSGLTFESAVLIAAGLEGVGGIVVDVAKKRVREYADVVAQVTKSVDAANVHGGRVGSDAENMSKTTDDTDRRARVALNEALNRQRKSLCESMTQLEEVDRNTVALADRASDIKGYVVVHRDRAAAAAHSAEEAATRAAAADAYASQASKEYLESIEAAKDARLVANRIAKTAARSLKANALHMQRVGASFSNTVKMVSGDACNVSVSVCGGEIECTVTRDLDKSLKEIQGLAALANVTNATRLFAQLVSSGEKATELLMEASKHANATEAAARAAVAAAEGARCAPVYTQMLRMLSNLFRKQSDK
ncbi:hypothetical protein ERJ75_001207000 [Trypanosoma vivax]|uniref:Uncharacterized protein n=1 Tax=Trypanosoma vivax (strain Y486) TaxID=1055687 RepID=F9WTM9_TRYVY|nr:hypothetical protein ERJ75_001207000 [Trypanosoma vivax]CCD20923.1 hypothetical protein, conserved in T. vivax [Trypanosoma vivax Y486]|eukprot:CCD20923.1 hypothetical protein, conserved in T. vivax [Trypanosoma vivax Y486]